MKVLNISYNCSANGVLTFFFGALELQMESYGLETVSKSNSFSFGHFFGFSHINYFYTGCGMYSQATPRLLSSLQAATSLLETVCK